MAGISEKFLQTTGKHVPVSAHAKEYISFSMTSQKKERERECDANLDKGRHSGVIGVAIARLHVQVASGTTCEGAGHLDGLELGALCTLRIEETLADDVHAPRDDASEVRVRRGVPRREVRHLRRSPE